MCEPTSRQKKAALRAVICILLEVCNTILDVIGGLWRRVNLLEGEFMENLIGNIQYEMKDGKLVLEIDTTGNGEPSKSGKSLVKASTRGNVGIPGTSLKLGLNLGR